MTKYLLPLFMLFAIYDATAQINYSVNNMTRYGNGEQLVGSTDMRFLEYIENQTNVRLYMQNFTLGLQYQYDDPPEFGPTFQGIDERYVEFENSGLNLRLGHFYTLFGKGLSMNLFEDRAINYDTKLDGFRGTYRNESVKIIGAAGTMTYFDLVNFSHKETYSVKSGHFEASPLGFLKVGGSLVGASGEIPASISSGGQSLFHNVDAEIKEGMITLSEYGFDFFASYAHKLSRVQSPLGGNQFAASESEGEGMYGSLIYTSDLGFGVTLEYKNYRFDPVNPGNRDPNRATKVLPFQNPPTAFREHAFYLLSRDPHQIDFNDEIGYQVDVFYAPTPEITFNLNGSQASRINRYSGTFGRWVIEQTLETLPSADREFSPWYEVYADMEWYFDGQSYMRLAVNKRYDAPYEEVGDFSHVIHSFTVPVRIEYVLDPIHSLGVSLEQQWFHDSIIRDKPSYYNQYLSVSFAKSPLWTLTLRMEYTTDETLTQSSLVSGKNFWRTLEASYRLGGAHTMTLSYGNERGGVVCSNGICRNVLPFNGVRFMLLTQL